MGVMASAQRVKGFFCSPALLSLMDPSTRPFFSTCLGFFRYHVEEARDSFAFQWDSFNYSGDFSAFFGIFFWILLGFWEDSWDSLGFQWDSFKYSGDSWDFFGIVMGFSGISVGFFQLFRGFLGFWEDFRDSLGFQWDSFKYSGDSWDIFGFSWDSNRISVRFQGFFEILLSSPT